MFSCLVENAGQNLLTILIFFKTLLQDFGLQSMCANEKGKLR